MKKTYIVFILIALIGGTFMQLSGDKERPEEYINKKIKLPQPKYDSNISLEQTLLKRRSIRKYKDEALTLNEISQILWAVQGITDKRGYRTSPSAGALYPLEIYIVIGNVSNLPKGIYKYDPHKHELTMLVKGDKRIELYNACLYQSSVKNAAAVIVISAIYERITVKYGKRGIRYTHIEVGHAAQNIYLQAVSLNLGTVAIGAFDDKKVKKILNMENKEQPVYIMPIGRK